MLREDVIQQLKQSIIPEIHIASLGEYCDVIDYISEAWREKIAERQINKNSTTDFYCGELSPWFRGVRKKKYPLESLLFRFYEKGVNEKFDGVRNLEIKQLESYFLQDILII